MRTDGFFPGLHQPSDAKHFASACISVRRLWGRKKPLGCPSVMVDSGAFTELNLYGEYRTSVEDYAAELYRLHTEGVVSITVAVAQDYMCEAFMLAKTGMTVADHQRLTIERYDALVKALGSVFSGTCPFPVLPVLQGYSPDDYVRHLRAYGDRIKSGMWVGVGSVCKRNGDPGAIAAVLKAIKRERPDIRLHGFGVKKTSIADARVRALLDTSDSMAWSYAARKQGRSANDWREAMAFARHIEALAAMPSIIQPDLFEEFAA